VAAAATAQCTSLLDPPRGWFWLKLLVQNLHDPSYTPLWSVFLVQTMFSLANYCRRAFYTDFLDASEASLEAPPMVYRAIAGMPFCKRMQVLNKRV